MVFVEEAAAAWPSGLSAVEGCVVVVVKSASVTVRAIFPLLCCSIVSIAIFMPTRRLTVVYLRFSIESNRCKRNKETVSLAPLFYRRVSTSTRKKEGM